MVKLLLKTYFIKIKFFRIEKICFFYFYIKNNLKTKTFQTKINKKCQRILNLILAVKDHHLLRSRERRLIVGHCRKKNGIDWGSNHLLLVWRTAMIVAMFHTHPVWVTHAIGCLCACPAHS